MTTTGKLAADLSHRIREVAQIRMDEPTVLSMYLSLDPTEFALARNRQAQIESLIDEARAQEESAALSHEGRSSLDADIKRVRDWIRTSLDPDGVHAIAIFACSTANTFHTFRLSGRVRHGVHIGRTAHLEPLTAALPTQAWCVFLVNRRTDRMMRGSRDRLFVVGDAADDVHGQHDQGGWSQARYQRSVHKEVSDHVQNACDRLFDAFQREAFDKLLVGCPEELWPEVHDKLHPYLVDRVVSRFDTDVEHSSADDVLRRAQPLMEDDERREEAALIERLAEQLGRRERAVAGLGPVLDALNGGRVEALLLQRDLHAAGAVCQRCGWLTIAAESCPRDSEPLQPLDDVVEPAVAAAVVQAATIQHIRHHEPDRALGGPIAALLRF